VCGFAPLQAKDDATEGELRDKFLSALRQPARLDVFTVADMLLKTEQVRVVHWLQQWCYDLISVQLTGKVRYHLGDEALMQKIVATVDPLNLMQLQKQLQTARREAQHTLSPKLFFQGMLLEYGKLISSR
jgi:DNA polymerase-3 subunit delta'